MSKEQITLTKSELKYAVVLEKWINGRLAEQDVARILDISFRQGYRLNAKYRHGGAQTSLMAIGAASPLTPWPIRSNNACCPADKGLLTV